MLAIRHLHTSVTNSSHWPGLRGPPSLHAPPPSPSPPPSVHAQSDPPPLSPPSVHDKHLSHASPLSACASNPRWDSAISLMVGAPRMGWIPCTHSPTTPIPHLPPRCMRTQLMLRASGQWQKPNTWVGCPAPTHPPKLPQATTRYISTQHPSKHPPTTRYPPTCPIHGTAQYHCMHFPTTQYPRMRP